MLHELSENAVQLETSMPQGKANSMHAGMHGHSGHVNEFGEGHGASHRNTPLLELVQFVIHARARRNAIFSASLFAEPAWDMLLQLFAVTLEQNRIAVSKLCALSGVPDSTGLRWIERLHSEGLVTRRNDPLDARRVWIELSDKGLSAMHRYLSEIAAAPLPS